ncbi:DUF397 domain-containing protein [Streptomyces sp. NPDC098781]|uniref:DUF397 domain-containing protein n=1 Tax=Streptomyces sp. NPDC098781 TaxID=3366097 RepID=UPI0038245B8B
MIRNTSAGNAAELVWFKSSYSSGSEGDSCVEVAVAPGTIHVRDSKYRDTSPRLVVAPESWAAFVTELLGES